MSDTIVALSSGGLPSGLAVVRISGPRTANLVEKITNTRFDSDSIRKAKLVSFEDQSNEIFDQGLLLCFAAPNSFTGEDIAEFHLHGSAAVVQHCLDALCAHDGVRLADPGEFTRRAFANGKMDLAQTEGLADLINAETQVQRRLAQVQSSGATSAIYEGLRQSLLQIRAMLEADMDFTDEDDVPGSVSDSALKQIPVLRSQLGELLQTSQRFASLRDGFRVAILGQPNVGKSTLLNSIANRDVAIVSDIAGTTRDTLEVRVDLGGYLVIFVDTAGLRESEDTVEQEGIRRAKRAAREANLIVALSETGEFGWLDAEDNGDDLLLVSSKSDMHSAHPKSDHLAISAKSGAGISDLLDIVRENAKSASADFQLVSTGRGRHQERIRLAFDALERAGRIGLDVDLVAEELRTASNALAEITGVIGTEDVLGEIFSSFCIGK